MAAEAAIGRRDAERYAGYACENRTATLGPTRVLFRPGEFFDGGVDEGRLAATVLVPRDLCLRLPCRLPVRSCWEMMW
jgi:hypothetical protein